MTEKYVVEVEKLDKKVPVKPLFGGKTSMAIRKN